jgi:hypothetical protein
MVSASGASTVADLTAILPVDLRPVVVLPAALIFGYLLPITVAAMPTSSYLTNEHQQMAIVLWQAFPTLVALLQKIFVQFVPNPGKASLTTTKRKLSTLYTFVFGVAAAAHLATLTFIVLPDFRPAYFTSSPGPGPTLSSTFLPMNPIAVPAVKSLAEGCLNLLQYDLYNASVAALLLFGNMYRATFKSSVFTILFKSAFVTALAGPGAALLWLIWERDEEVISKMEKLTATKKK